MECENISCETERFLYFLKGKGERSRAVRQKLQQGISYFVQLFAS
jgi:hypothetical protein